MNNQGFEVDTKERKHKERLYWSFLGALMLALMAGCNFAPKYHVPPIAMPPAYKETNGWKAAEPSDGKIKGNWWEMFGDPELNELEVRAGISNQTVVAALENFLAARAVAKQARSQLFPTLGAEPAFTETQTSQNGGTSGIAVLPGSNSVSRTSGSLASYSLPLDATWEPDLWGSIRNTVKANSYAAQSTAAQLQNMLLAVQAEVAVDYYELRSQDTLIELYSNTIVGYRASLDLTKILFETGIDSDLDVAEADSLLETTLAQATALGIARAQYEHAIAMLIGESASAFSLKPSRHLYQAPTVPIGLPAQLLERRPDISAAERTAASANATVGVARAAFFPTISLTGEAGLQSSTLSKLLQASSFYWAAGAAASETIFDAGRRRAATQQAWANYRSAAATYRETVLTAFEQVEDDLASLRILSAETRQQDIAVRAAQRNYDLSIQRYRLGITSYLTVITAQQALLSNEQTAVNIHMQQMTASVQLIMALGGGWNTNDLPSAKRIPRGPLF